MPSEESDDIEIIVRKSMKIEDRWHRTYGQGRIMVLPGPKAGNLLWVQALDILCCPGTGRRLNYNFFRAHCHWNGEMLQKNLWKTAIFISRSFGALKVGKFFAVTGIPGPYRGLDPGAQTLRLQPHQPCG